MGWDDAFGGSDTPGQSQLVELVGIHLRLTGNIQLGRFTRLTDFVNASRGFVRIHDVRLLLPDGKPTDLALSELLVDQDEISFIAQDDPPAPDDGVAVGFIESRFEATAAVRKAREYVMFTPGHSITGKVHVFGQTDVVAFVDATDPHFIPVTEATTRSLADSRIVSTYDFVLINREQMIAVSEVATPDEPEPEPEDRPAT